METQNVIIIRYSEIHLKGGNRGYFEKALLKNIRLSLEGIECNTSKYASRYFVSNYNPDDENKITERLKTVFGIHSFSKALQIKSDKTLLFNYFKDFKLSAKTFKVDTTRADKSFPMNSVEISREIGGIILDNNENLKVDLHNPEAVVNIDIRENGFTYIFYDTIKGLGGMPVGTAGKGLVMLSGGIDSPVAAFKVAKRGMNIMAIHYHSFPYTSEQAKNKVIKLASLVKPYTHIHKMIVIPFTKIQEEIHKNCNNEYMITIMRRFMVRIAEKVANTYKCQSIITGESLGQVASQTIESITSTNSVAEKLPILRPLITMDKEEIVEVAKMINTFETSILPYEDCCTVFLPKNPIIKPKLEKVQKEEEKLDIEKLVNDAVENLEEIIIN
ncbi:MAG: tRNA 4-thiouridine(8) synthase ThiI [Clostridiales bacterium]|nr:tRNA 4-thiouridine(8) synthase ThiI [Candidatus Apopatousia equi]